GSSELFRHISRYPGKSRFFLAAPLKKVFKKTVFFGSKIYISQQFLPKMKSQQTIPKYLSDAGWKPLFTGIIRFSGLLFLAEW
ncbi:hypothetical protein ACR2WA_25395, partial [Klebsiella pneumoniae]